jgi:hypothetical protein
LLWPPDRISVAGLQHAECLVLMRFGAPIVSPARLQLRRFAMFAQWDDESALDRFLDTHAFGRRLATGWGHLGHHLLPARIALWLLVTTISRRVQQLDLPLDGLDTARGITSEIILLRDSSGAVRYTGWFRRRLHDGRVLYTGFYMTQRIPADEVTCVKAVFPMPDGNATVVLRPVNDGTGFRLTSVGTGFGDAGFYRVRRSGDGIRIWRVAHLHDTFHVYIDQEGCVHGDHEIRFLGVRVITLHYRMVPVHAERS